MKKSKWLNAGCFKFSYPGKILLKMKLTLVFILAGIIQVVAINSYSQTTRLTMELRNVSVVDVLRAIENQSEFYFVYNKDAINMDRKVDLNAKNLLIEEILDHLFKDTNVSYQIADRHIILSTLEVSQQQKSVSGKVTDSSGSPLIGVTVVVKGTTTGVITDTNGKYSLDNVTSNSTLVFSFVGMKSQEVLLSGRTSVNVVLTEETIGIDEVIAVGYQTQRKADLTGAVSTLKVSDTEDIPVGNALKAVQGRIPGVLITTDGTPNGGATVRIRGIGTLGNNDPLYIIDGVPTKRGLEQMNSNDIESFQVLKDASSASIYGSRAANGVIIITTKKGKIGDTKVVLNSSISTQIYNTKTEVLNAQERGQVYWQAAVNDGTDPNSTGAVYKYDWNGDFTHPVLNKVVIPEYIDAAKTMKASDTNWYDEISQTSLIQTYDLTISNASEKGNYMLGMGYYDNKGIIKGTFSKRYSARYNSEYNLINGKFHIGENLSLTHIIRDRIPATGGDAVADETLMSQPLVPVHTVDGGWGGPVGGMSDTQNPVRFIEQNLQNKNYFARILGNVYADLEIIPQLHLKSSFGIDYTGDYQRTLKKSFSSGFLSDPTNQVRNNQNYDGSLTWQNTLTYNLKIDKNVFDFLLGHEQIKYNNQNFSASRQGLILENIDYAYLDAGTTNIQNNGSGTSYALQSFFGKVNYVFNNRYLASATIRRDGSSRFGKNNRYGIFPAFSLGWRISEENFFKKSLPFISDFKLRYGWGKNGNQEIANNGTFTLYQAIYGTDRTWSQDKGTAYDIAGNDNGQLPSGFVRAQTGNDDLKWETTVQSNWGIDFGFMNNRLTGTADYFVKKTSDILIVPPRLAVFGGGTPAWENGASMENKGFEFILSYNGSINELHYSISGNISSYQNKVTELPTNSLSAYAGNGTNKTILGRSINSLFGYVADGLFTSQAEVDAAAAQPGKGVGRIHYKDLNGDKIINADDRDYIGVGDPDFTYGLNLSVDYKKFDITAFFQGISGIDVNNGYKFLTDFSSLAGGVNWGRRTLDTWSPTNTSSTIPSLTLIDKNNESRFSTYFIESGSYLKLRNFQVGYTINKIGGINGNARVYLQGSNLLTIKSSKYTGADPEMPGFSYPNPAIYSIGFNLSF